MLLNKPNSIKPEGLQHIKYLTDKLKQWAKLLLYNLHSNLEDLLNLRHRLW